MFASAEIGENLLTATLAFFGLVSSIATLILTNHRTKELKTNGGKSMHDKVDKVYRTVAAKDRATDNPKVQTELIEVFEVEG